MTEFKLGDDDCALILKANGATDIIMPNYKDDSMKAGDNMILAVAIATLIPTKEFKKLIDTTITKLSENFDKELGKERKDE